MLRQLRGFPFLLLTLLLTLTGCGDVVSPEHPGEPLVTITGQMMPTPDAQLTGEIRLALVWYPQWLAADDREGPPGVLQEVITEDVVYQGSFPANYRFHIYRPPPEEALAELGEGLQGKGAFGILLAYKDGNGNGKLDPIAMHGAPVDRVIGSSLLGGERSTFAVVYVSTEQPAATGLKPGFNLIQGVNSESSAVVPPSTSLPLSLTSGGPFFDAFVCEAGWLTFLALDVCGLDGGDVIEQGKLTVEGRVGLNGTEAKVELEVRYENQARQDATVTLNGRSIPYDTRFAAYSFSEPNSAQLTPGSSFEIAVTLGQDSLRRTFRMPGEFAITAPTADTQARSGEPLTLRWTASEGATAYFAGFGAGQAGMGIIVEDGSLAYTFDTTNASGQGEAYVEARITPTDVESWVTTALSRERTFSFVP
ncbi:hypothetical protein [Hyalangium rubrum]|uniref:Lipoprotein n=1 Tax=Hyalangium rubrum TaxID=3103134 RepID=A0ABU5HFG8_9BACT|nr:hypothetical protein [Hyalangium sp. s54d21]MDY7231879.1 hypothetical protein [Hyalangium sp. s54d21]